ncbi:MAG: hypothetical protein AMXMBFR53_13370 [Gemmatimonadota bacterium]
MIGQTFDLVRSMFDALGWGFVLAMAFPGFVALGLLLLRVALRRDRVATEEVAGD